MIRHLAGFTLATAAVCGVALWTLPAHAAAGDDATFQDAREAWRVRDKARLQVARDALMSARHPLAPWADYWWVTLRLTELGRTEADEFLARWPDSYVADRFRNDWLLELGHRQDWPTYLRIQPSFRMNDDREVVCWGVLARQQTGSLMEGPGDHREQARQAWWAQKDADRGCDAMSQALWAAGVLAPEDVWRKLRLVVENDRPNAIQQSGKLMGDVISQAVGRLMAQPQAFCSPLRARPSPCRWARTRARVCHQARPSGHLARRARTNPRPTRTART